ncbi:hypothetical protein L226DRAFT_292527 [Lentinus tigrinus ALCF2SS1-7]|uniref:uncharacterized protein n=1 Tax=Lentinus tigrinus ALCF2SS1-7 TaxID=1328758 RepID=UPI00116618F0|nr:hypothetical protein L226DRAFT_292527 [Lentinus tigrinus ALCF2SS1-7]
MTRQLKMRGHSTQDCHLALRWKRRRNRRRRSQTHPNRRTVVYQTTLLLNALFPFPETTMKSTRSCPHCPRCACIPDPRLLIPPPKHHFAAPLVRFGMNSVKMTRTKTRTMTMSASRPSPRASRNPFARYSELR